jgi:hypothetical protein
LFFSASALQAAIIFCASGDVRQGLVRMSSPCVASDRFVMGQPEKVNQILFRPLGVCCPYQFPMDVPGD